MMVMVSSHWLLMAQLALVKGTECRDHGEMACVAEAGSGRNLCTWARTFAMYLGIRILVPFADQPSGMHQMDIDLKPSASPVRA